MERTARLADADSIDAGSRRAAAGGARRVPEAPTPPNARRIVVDVLDLRRTTDGYAMQVSWSLLPQPGRSRQLALSAAGSDDVAGQTRAISAMIGQLASDIAAGS